MTDIKAKNIGSVVNNPNAPVNITNVFNSGKDISLHSNIPLPKGFIGRESDLSELRAAKDRSITSFVLHGAGGVGKTDLALKFIGENKTTNRKAYQINMFGLSKNPKSWIEAMLEVIKNFRPDVPADLNEPEIENLYAGLLNEHKPILFFDNAKDRDQVENLTTPSALIVITSRMTFNVTGGFSKTIEQMSPEDARNLLYSIAEEARFNGDADKLAYLGGYLPIALLPLASLLANDITLDAKKLVQRYSDRKVSLQLKDPNRENLSIEASFDLSYESLSDELKKLWRTLSVFPTDFDLKAMEFVWDIDDGFDVRSELIKKHLLEFNQKSARSQLHDLAQDYAFEKLSNEELHLAKSFHSIYFSEFLSSLNDVTSNNIAKFDLERINIKYGFLWVKFNIENSRNFASLCINYVFQCEEIISLQLHPLELIEWFEAGISASKILEDNSIEANLLDRLGQTFDSLGKYEEAIDCYEKALHISKINNAPLAEGSILGDIGVTYYNQADFKRARFYAEQSLEILKRVKHRKGEGKQLMNLGSTYFGEENYAKSIEYFEQSLSIAEEVNNVRDKGTILGNLGTANLHLGNVTKSIEYSKQGLFIAEEIGNLEGQILSNIYLGNAHAYLKKFSEADIYYNNSLNISISISHPLGMVQSLGNLGNSYISQKKYKEGLILIEQALEIANKIGNQSIEQWLLKSLERLNEKGY